MNRSRWSAPAPVRALALAFALVLSLVATSCASAERLGRISPLAGDAARDRVSLWPFVVHSGNGTAVLWPLFDVDDQGFALRPVVAVDGTRWEVLYPWSSFDSATGRGWAVPFYASAANAGCFPIANFGPWSWVGPFWWRRDAGGALQSGGLFPLVLFGDTSYVGPFWWTDARGGLFPVAHFGEFNYVGPAWWSRASGAFGLFPLFGTASVRHVGPVWWTDSAEEGYSAGVFPFVWFDDTGKRFAFLPFYSHDLLPKSRSRNFLLGLVHAALDEEGSERWVLPLYYDRDKRGKADTVLFPLFWKRTREGKSQVFTLLGNRSVDPESKSLNLYPLWWSNESAQASWKMLFPLFYYGEEGDERTLLTPLGGRGWSGSGETRYFNVLGPVYHRSRSADGNKERTAILWPLFERRRDGEETTTRAAPFYSSSTTPKGSEGWYAAGLGQFQRTAAGRSHRLWPFYSTTEEEVRPGLLYDLTLYGSRASGGATARRLFPLFDSETNAAGTDVNFLLGLGGYSRVGDSTSWRLWPLVAHSESEEDSPLAHWTTLFGDRSFAGHASWHVGGPFLFTSRADERDGVRTRKRRLLTLFTDERTDALGTVVPDGLRAGKRNLVREREQAFLFGAFRRESREYRVWRDGAVTDEEAKILSPFSTRFDGSRQAPRDEARAKLVLAERNLAPEGDGPRAVQDAVAAFADSATRTVEESEVHLPLLYDYEHVGERVEWSGPLWLVRSKDEPGRSKFSVLYYAYRSETKGDETRRDIFPFVTWDTSPRETEVSFFWRLFHYRRDAEGRSGHFLFIPW